MKVALLGSGGAHRHESSFTFGRERGVGLVTGEKAGVFAAL
jgi:hypothetical protein